MIFDTLEVAQQEGRAPWTEIEIDTRDFVVYNDILLLPINKLMIVYMLYTIDY